MVEAANQFKQLVRVKIEDGAVWINLRHRTVEFFVRYPRSKAGRRFASELMNCWILSGKLPIEERLSTFQNLAKKLKKDFPSSI